MSARAFVSSPERLPEPAARGRSVTTATWPTRTAATSSAPWRPSAASPAVREPPPTFPTSARARVSARRRCQRPSGRTCAPARTTRRPTAASTRTASRPPLARSAAPPRSHAASARSRRDEPSGRRGRGLAFESASLSAEAARPGDKVQIGGCTAWR